MTGGVAVPGTQVPGVVQNQARSTPPADPHAGFTEEEVARIERRTTPPKKWADPDRTEVTPQWCVWHRARKQAIEDEHRSILRNGFGPQTSDWANEAIYFPEDFDRVLPDEGGWIMVIDPPQAVALDFKVPLLSMWFARPHVLNSGKFGDRLPYQAVIQTPAGDLHLWPHEYVVMSEPEALLGEPGVDIHRLGGEPLLDADMVFYLCSRGIERREATLMLFSQIREPNYCYVTFPPEAVEMFAGVGTRPGSGVRADYAAGRLA